jgi:hypothetical protein
MQLLIYNTSYGPSEKPKLEPLGRLHSWKQLVSLQMSHSQTLKIPLSMVKTIGQYPHADLALWWNPLLNVSYPFVWETGSHFLSQWKVFPASMHRIWLAQKNGCQSPRRRDKSDWRSPYGPMGQKRVVSTRIEKFTYYSIFWTKTSKGDWSIKDGPFRPVPFDGNQGTGMIDMISNWGSKIHYYNGIFWVHPAKST